MFVGSNPTLSARAVNELSKHRESMVVRVGASATASRESRQARKGAAVAVMPGAGAWLARTTSMALAMASAGSDFVL